MVRVHLGTGFWRLFGIKLSPRGGNFGPDEALWVPGLEPATVSKGPSVREMAIGGHKVHKIRSLCKRDALPHAAAKDKDLPLVRLDWNQLNAKPALRTPLAWVWRAGASHSFEFPIRVFPLQFRSA